MVHTSLRNFLENVESQLDSNYSRVKSILSDMCSILLTADESINMNLCEFYMTIYNKSDVSISLVDVVDIIDCAVRNHTDLLLLLSDLTNDLYDQITSIDRSQGYFILDRNQLFQQ